MRDVVLDVRCVLLDIDGQKLLTSREILCGFRCNLCQFLVDEGLTQQVDLQATGDFFQCLILLLRQKMV